MVPRHVPGSFFLRNLVQRRSLLFQLVRRDFQQRFVGSTIGWIWGLIHPLVLLVAWTFVFQVCLKQEAPPGFKSYPLFIFAGMLPWLLFSDTVQRSASSLIDQSNLITKTVFPAEIVPVSVFLSSLVSHILALVLVLAAARHVSVFLVLLPIYIFLIGLLAIGLGWIFSSLHVYLRDTAQMLSVLLTFWFWLTPIMITEDRIPAKARFLLLANPMFYVVRSYRRLLLTSGLPSATDLAIVAGAGTGVFVIGGLFFRYMKKGFADVL